MFNVLRTKSGDVIWYPSYTPILGYHEAARLQFAAYERQKVRNSLKLLDTQLSNKEL